MTTNADDLRTPRDCALYCRRELMASVAPVFNPEHSSGEYIEIEKTTGLVKERKVVAASSEDIDQKYKKAPISEEEIDELFDKNPTLNYCIYLGKVSNNMIVVETDGPDSAERLESRILQNLESEVRTAFINTMQVTSGGGGKHYYFQLND